MNLINLSVQQLRQAANIKEKIVGLEKQLATILGSPTKSVVTKAPKKKWTMSKAARAKISAAAKKRWAKVKTAKPTVKKARKKMSAAAKAKLSALAKARWAKVKSTGKKTL